MKNKKNDINDEIDQVLSGSAQSKNSGSANQSEPQSLMAKLLKDHPVKIKKEGDKAEGTIIQIDNNAIYIDLGVLGTGVVYGKEIKDGISNRKKLEVGDKIVATIIELENEEGYIELSIREAARDEAWEDLARRRDSNDIISTKILDANKGGLMVEVNGITGFMPVSQLTAEHYPRVEDGDKNKILEILRAYIGTEMTVAVIDVDKEDEKLIVSEKEAHKDKEKAAISELKVGDVIEGEISGVVDFGAFVKFYPPSKQDSTREEDKLEGLVHISQLDWKLIDNPRDIVKVGDKVKAKIIDINETRISLSIRDLKLDPWSEVAKNYKAGDMVKGTVHKINHFGAFVYLNDDIHGLAHVSEFLEKNPKKNIDDVIKIGETYNWQIMSLEPNEHRMGLKFAPKGEVKESKSSVATSSADASKVKKAMEDRKEEKPEKESKEDKETKVEKAEEKKEKTTKKKAEKKEPTAKKAKADKEEK